MLSSAVGFTLSSAVGFTLSSAVGFMLSSAVGFTLSSAVGLVEFSLPSLKEVVADPLPKHLLLVGRVLLCNCSSKEVVTASNAPVSSDNKMVCAGFCVVANLVCMGTVSCSERHGMFWYV